MLKFPRYDDVIVQFKILVPNSDNSDNYDSVIDFTLSKVLNDMANYTNIPINELPEELDTTIISIALQTIETHQWLKPIDDRSGNVQSLSEGDTSASFRSPAEIYQSLQSTNTITDNFINTLNSFRRVPL